MKDLTQPVKPIIEKYPLTFLWITIMTTASTALLIIEVFLQHG